MKKFYRWLLSSSWAERLRAYACIERDLRKRRRWGMSEDKWEDLKKLSECLNESTHKNFNKKEL